MRRVLASLLVFLLTFALVARGVAAPLMHLHPDAPMPAPAAMSQQDHDHTDCGEVVLDDGAGATDGALAHTHTDHTKDKSAPLDHGKACDANGACCGPLALSESPESVFGLAAIPQPSLIAVSTGVKPLNPDRPPSPPIA
jgi:hypothetical protein